MVLLEELEDIETTAIQLGFALPIASKPSASSTLLAHLLPDDADPNSEFPSKVGGIPNWLNPLQSPSSSDLSCGVCANPMALITQIFTPEDTPAEAYHRVIYLFCCRNGKCHKEDWTSSCVYSLIRSFFDQDRCLLIVGSTLIIYLQPNTHYLFYQP